METDIHEYLNEVELKEFQDAQPKAWVNLDVQFRNSDTHFPTHLSDVHTMIDSLSLEERQRRILAEKVLNISIHKLNEEDNLRSNSNRRSAEPGLYKRLLVTQALKNVASNYLPQDLPGVAPETDLQDIIYNSIKKTENSPESDDILNEFISNNNEILDKCLSEMMCETSSPHIVESEEQPEVLEMCNMDDGTITLTENSFTAKAKRKIPTVKLDDENIKRMKLSGIEETSDVPEYNTDNNKMEVEQQFTHIMKGGLNALSPDDICDFLCDKMPTTSVFMDMESVETLSSIIQNTFHKFSLCSQEVGHNIEQHYQSTSVPMAVTQTV